MPWLAGRNPVLEALRRQRRQVHRVLLDRGAKSEDRLEEIEALCESRRVRLERIPRQELDRLAKGGVHNGILAEVDPLPRVSLAQILKRCAMEGREPFILVADEIHYEHNLGAILRSALGAGVDAVVIPSKRTRGLSPVVERVSMGGAEAVPLIQQGLSSALAQCRRAGLTVLGATMDGEPCWSVPMTGPLALVLGGESKGLTHTLQARCDQLVSVPLAGELQSLNVSVSAAVLMFERVRQQRAEGLP